MHREVVLLLAWGRAILLQFSHPLVARGVADHSDFRRGFGAWSTRLRRTVGAMLAMTFGGPERAARAAAGINSIHRRVHGRLRQAEGIFPEGTTYDARDPELLRWVHATLVESHLLVYELYVGRLTQDERDRYCAEAGAVEPLLGIPAGFLPRSEAALHSYLDAMLASGVITVTETARTLARAVLAPPLPFAMDPVLWPLRLPTIGLLPPAIREGYGFTWGRRRQAALEASAWLVRHLLPVVPAPIRYWPLARPPA